MTDSILAALGLLALVMICCAGVVAYAVGRAAAAVELLTGALWAQAREAAHRRR